MCDFSSDVLADPVKGNEIAELFSPKWNKLLSSDCISETGLPLTEYIQLDDEALKSNYDEISVFLDGFSHYGNFLVQVQPDIKNNNFTEVSDTWNLYKIGQLSNFSSMQGIFLDKNK